MVGLALKIGPIPTNECTIQADMIVIVAHGSEAKVSALRSYRFSRRGRPQPSSFGDYPNSRYAEPVATKARDGGDNGGSTTVPDREVGLRQEMRIVWCRRHSRRWPYMGWFVTLPG